VAYPTTPHGQGLVESGLVPDSAPTDAIWYKFITELDREEGREDNATCNRK
jgi:hypothetical protein